ncbi:MAG TPA: TraR/DksA C4-type zinc finger protein [Pyrinomonadaceae bacterium]|jgi:RNA polymerase-binding transcription factor DksA|nr:TraR/DksA C4-type zinc finger protein [Pyrinomonadaceae bacterium]
MDDALLLESAEGLDDSSFMATNGTIWNSLQNLKEEVSQELNVEGPLCQADPTGSLMDDILEADGLEIEWAHRGQLEAQLYAITHAQDRLLEGTYDKCEDCGEKINPGRLAVNPCASLCLACQTIADGERKFRTL